MPREIKLDDWGEPRRDTDAARAYKLQRMAHPEWTHRQCAIAMGVPAAKADDTAARLEANPFVQQALDEMLREGMTRAVSERNAWIARVKRRGNKAEVARQFAASLKSDDMLAERGCVEGILSGEDVVKAPISVNIVLVWGGTNEVSEAPTAIEGVVKGAG